MAAETMLLKAVDYALQLLRNRESRSTQEREAQRAFGEAFREALILTRAYLADRRDGIIDRNREKELELSHAWNRVGLRGKDLEPLGDFYAVYFEKSDYWSDPSGWVVSNPSDLDISLERAEEEAARFFQSR